MLSANSGAEREALAMLNMVGQSSLYGCLVGTQIQLLADNLAF